VKYIKYIHIYIYSGREIKHSSSNLSQNRQQSLLE
jgi:hypothetical protein